MTCFLSYFWAEAGGSSARSSPNIISEARIASGPHERRAILLNLNASGTPSFAREMFVKQGCYSRTDG